MLTLMALAEHPSLAGACDEFTCRGRTDAALLRHRNDGSTTFLRPRCLIVTGYPGIVQVGILPAPVRGACRRLRWWLRRGQFPPALMAFHDFEEYERLTKAALDIDMNTYVIVLLGGKPVFAVER